MEKYSQKIAYIIRKKNGLINSSIGNILIDTFIQQRMASCNITKIKEYYEYINKNQKELGQLIEASVVSETWFFRESIAFNHILKTINEKNLHNNIYTSNILSIPCSTGEEPYSLSMFLNENKTPDYNYSIDAFDISENSLYHAEQGAYRKNSFREKDYSLYQHKYFKKNNNAYQLNSSIRKSVNFHKKNILDLTINNNIKYDFILCRNLLIYFDEETKLIALNNLLNLLKKDGQLYVGLAEFGCIPKNLFSHIKHTHVFEIKKNLTEPKPTKRLSLKDSKLKTTPIKKNIITTTNKNNTLVKARELADKGHFKEAKKLCESFILSYGNNYESFFLLGLISNCQNNTLDAESFFKKSLYLNPKHYESLVFLSLIMEHKGDSINALRLKNRANEATQS